MSTMPSKAAFARVREKSFAARKLDEPGQSLHRFSASTDAALVQAYGACIDPADPDVCLVALGGYGRRELFPYSDVDILVLHHGSDRPEKVERIVRAFWDLGMDLGCVVRTVAQCRQILGDDPATDAAFLDRRPIAGSASLFERLESHAIRPHFRRRGKAFADEMTSALRHGMFSADTGVYQVEPDLKNGICGLRDCQRMIWARMATGGAARHAEPDDLLPLSAEELAQYRSAHALIASLRIELHLAAKRRIDVLEVSFQESLARALASDGRPATLMESYFLAVHDIRNTVMCYLERHKRRTGIVTSARRWAGAVNVLSSVQLLDGILIPSSSAPSVNAASPVWMLTVFAEAQRCQAFVGIELCNLIRAAVALRDRTEFITPELDALLRRMLSDARAVGTVVTQMHECGLLGAIIPEFEQLRCKVEYDSYHEFTVDQHILLALRALDDLGSEPDLYIRSAFARMPRLFILRIALLLHDIGKALPGDHAYVGAVVTGSICDRLGLDDDEKHRVMVLIHNHLELSRLAFQREPEQETIRRFAARVEDAENLDMLHILTVLDIRSVGRKTWTEWKGLQVRAVHERTAALLSGGQVRDGADPTAESGLPDSEPGLLLRVQTLSSVTAPEELIVHTEEFVGFHRLTACGVDRPGFFAALVACMSSEGCGILGAKISTTADGKALDTFHVEPSTLPIIPMEQCVRNMRRKWRALSLGEATAEQLMSERFHRYPPEPVRRAETTPGQVRLDNSVSPDFTVCEVEAADRFGLLYTIASCLSAQRVNIVSARLSTRIDRAVDVFYLTDLAHHKIADGDLVVEIGRALRAALSARAGQGA